MSFIPSRPLISPEVLFPPGEKKQTAPKPLPGKAIPSTTEPKDQLSTQVTGHSNAPLSNLAIEENIPPGLDRAAEQAYKKFKNQPTACEQTANYLHSLLMNQSPLSVRYLPKATDLKENGQSLTYLKTLIDSHKLKPGMVIFINSDPAMKMPNLTPSDRHWFTYLGMDPVSRQAAFCDQFGTRRTVDEMIKTFSPIYYPDIPNHKERLIHTIFDPYSSQPDKLQ